MSDENERAEWIYTSVDETLVVRVDAPAGYIMPPSIELHQPGVGRVSVCFEEVHRVPAKVPS